MDSSLRYADSSVHDISLGIRPHLHDEVVAVASHINQEIDAANSEFPLLDEDTEAFLKGLFGLTSERVDVVLAASEIDPTIEAFLSHELTFEAHTSFGLRIGESEEETLRFMDSRRFSDN